MEINQNIKDAIIATVIIAALLVLIVVGIGIYDSIAHPEIEEVSRFIALAFIFHDDLDENEVKDDIFNFIDNISISQIEDPQGMDSVLVRESSKIRAYKERFYLLVSPTDEMRTLKESMIEEGSLFLVSYSYLREALGNKNDSDYDACLSNIEQAKLKLDEAMNLRNQNKESLDQWRIKIDAAFSD